MILDFGTEIGFAFFTLRQESNYVFFLNTVRNAYDNRNPVEKDSYDMHLMQKSA